MYFIKSLEYVAVMMSMDTHLKVVLDFGVVFYLYFLLIVKIWHDVQNGAGSTLISMSCQQFSVSPASINLVDLCPNIWCNNSKKKVFLGICFCDFHFSFIFTKNAFFLCALCVNVTALCSLSLKKTVQNPLLKRKLCPEFINVIMENNWLHNYCANSTLYNISIKGFPLSSRIFIWNYPVFFSLWKMPICNLITFICFYQWSRYKIRNLLCHVKSLTWV